MRIALMGLAALIAAAAIDARSAHAQFSRQYCSQGGGPESSGLLDCSFNTWEQCRAAVQGLGRYCTENPEIAWRARGWKDPNDQVRQNGRQHQ